MSIFLWVITCLLAAVGFAQIIGWALRRLQVPADTGAGYQVMLLIDDPDLLEAQLRNVLMTLDWSIRRPELLILLDDGLGDECKTICKRLLCDAAGVIVCAPDQLKDIILGS